MSLTVLVNAGPWVPVPPSGYGGIEKLVSVLVPELRARGVHVVLVTVGESTLEADEHLATFPRGQLECLHWPYHRAAGIAVAHMQMVLRVLRDRRDIDLVHDHLEVAGPAMIAAMGQQATPTLHTLHWDLSANAEFYAHFDGGGRVFVNAVSEPQLRQGPANLIAQALGCVPLASPIPDETPSCERGEHLLVLANVSRRKGQDLAARLCRAAGLPLVLAGPVAGLDTREEVDRVLGDPGHPLHGSEDLRYFVEDVAPQIDGEMVRWIGTVGGVDKDQLLQSARALLMPIRWEEPGATAVVEALAAGTPVVGMRRGALPALIEHGVTGWLADSEAEFAHYLKHVDELDPGRCRSVAVERFSPARMTESYLTLYDEVLHRTGTFRASHSAYRMCTSVSAGAPTTLDGAV